MGAGLNALHPSVFLLRAWHDSVPQEALTPPATPFMSQKGSAYFRPCDVT